ncbi:hypothetical protein B7Z28_02110 [Candidatus Saccharibacteria bacterium 32-45-3]|nr:MAG: hypothetical protein B7Z28_02110 [Candidatus Saccharibacteria bacterium 32-45-3]
MVIAYGGNAAAQVLMLSPIAVIFQNARAQVVGHENVVTADQLFSNPVYLVAPYVTILAVMLLAAMYFKKSQSKFAELV